MMERSVSFIALFMLGLGLFSSQAFDIEIKDAFNQTCINASLMVNFTIQYETNTTRFKNVTSEIPSKVTTTGSRCGGEGEAPLLLVGFGNNYTWSLNFTKNETMYRGSVLTFTYNTNDTDLFPDALRKGLLMSTTTFLDPIPLNTTYKCNHIEVIPATNVVQQFWDVKLQAFVQNGVSVRDIICDADKPTPSPTQKPTDHPTESPTPAPKPVDKPITGNYSVSNATGICLLAHMGLQVNASVIVEGKSVWMPFNIDPNTTRSSGSCSNETSVLKLSDNSTTIEFLFAIKNNHFFLQEVNITLTNGSGSVSKVNNNLTTWEASLGSSYLCHKEQVVSVSEDVFINTFDVWVQPFGLQSDKFSTAEECPLDDDTVLIPIIVGAALAGLIVIIVVAYLIGRRKSYAGYQTL